MSVGWKAHLYNLRLHHHHTVCNSRGNPDNAGNSRAKGIVDNAGNSRRNPDNASNINCGRQKKSAGRRSGVKRCAKFALVVKKYWLDKILAREKDWEIRSCSTARRGLIHFAQSKAGGKLVGRVSNTHTHTEFSVGFGIGIFGISDNWLANIGPILFPKWAKFCCRNRIWKCFPSPSGLQRPSGPDLGPCWDRFRSNFKQLFDNCGQHLDKIINQSNVYTNLSSYIVYIYLAHLRSCHRISF